MPPLGTTARRARAYVGGTFDLFHPGHLGLFEKVKQLATHLTVSLNTDAFATRYKRRPVMSLGERMAMVADCRLVDAVIVNAGDEDSRPAILHARANLVVHGDDWTGDALMAQMGLTHAWLAEHNIALTYVPYTAGVSTRDIIARIQRGDGNG